MRHHPIPASVLCSMAVASASLLALGCGSGGGSVGARAHPAQASARGSVSAKSEAAVPRYAGVPRYPGDDDGDNDANDDENIRTFGHPASRAQERAMVATLRRYYAIAVGEDGSRACAMLTRGMRAAVPIEYGRYGGRFERGSTCPAVMSGMFAHYHRELRTEDERMQVIAARLEGEKGYVVVRPHSPCLPSMCVLNTRELKIAKLLMQREGGSWRVQSLFLKV